MKVDQTFPNNVLSQNTNLSRVTIHRVTIHSSEILKSTELFGLYKSKNVLYTINTKVGAGLLDRSKNKVDWSVQRLESDFYHLRNILSMTYG